MLRFQQVSKILLKMVPKYWICRKENFKR